MKKRYRSGKGRRRGYVMLAVLVVLVILLSAGTYGVQAVDAELRATNKFKRSELLLRAAEAGAAHRLSEIALMKEPIAILNEGDSLPSASWTMWPPTGSFSLSGAMDGRMRYRTAPVRLVWVGTTPPPGIALGTKTYILEVTSYSVFGDVSDAAEGAVSIGLKTWDQMPGSYAP